METSTPKPEEIIDDCIICQDKVTVPVDTPCKHGPFDLHCLNNWLEQQRTCPICIQDIPDNSFIDRPDLLKQPVTLQISYSKNKSVMLKVAPEATIDTVKFATCRQIDQHVSYKDTNLYANLFDMKKNKLDPTKSLQDYKMTAKETYPLVLARSFYV